VSTCGADLRILRISSAPLETYRPPMMAAPLSSPPPP
jgi:hypothetical protein